MPCDSASGAVSFCFRFWCFFFSSRRRHTRWPRDWSSDVCSSDLPAALGKGVLGAQVVHMARGILIGLVALVVDDGVDAFNVFIIGFEAVVQVAVVGAQLQIGGGPEHHLDFRPGFHRLAGIRYLAAARGRGENQLLQTGFAVVEGGSVELEALIKPAGILTQLVGLDLFRVVNANTTL